MFVSLRPTIGDFHHDHGFARRTLFFSAFIGHCFQWLPNHLIHGVFLMLSFIDHDVHCRNVNPPPQGGGWCDLEAL